MEKVLQGEDIPVKIIPVPRQISASCGLAARTQADDYDFVKNLIDENEIETDNIYIMSDSNIMSYENTHCHDLKRLES